MRRRSRSPEHLAATTRSKLAALGRSPLQSVYEKLSQTIDQALCSTQAGSASPDGLRKLCRYAEHVIERLPQTLGERFHLDAGVIQAMCRDVGGAVKLSSMVVPRYGRRWGHERIVMPSEDLTQAHVIDLIHFPGRDRLEDVDLLDYPWLLHELAHCLLSSDDSAFAAPFIRKLEGMTRSFRLASIADRGGARLKSDARLNEMVQFWRPFRGHANWSHELAIDVISLWLCGPAYLAAFGDVVDQPDVNPYKIVQDHPPYAVRSQALAAAAADLGFDEYASALVTLERAWRKSKWGRQRDNRFLSLANHELISECTRSAFAFCRQTNLRKCTPERVGHILTQVRGQIAEIPQDEVGIDLILSATLIHRELGDNAYEEWAIQRVRNLSTLVIQLSQ